MYRGNCNMKMIARFSLLALGLLCTSVAGKHGQASPVLRSNPSTKTRLVKPTLSPSHAPIASARPVANLGKALQRTVGGAIDMPPAMKLLIGVGGIYAAFMKYGLLQEAVFKYRAADGGQFTQVWFLMVLESFANVLVGSAGMQITGGGTKNLPKREFALSGATQVMAKACTNLALRYGVSFPIVTLAKSGKMVPVMIGSIVLGGASYSIREYLQVIMIIGGTCLVSMAKKKGAGGPSSVGGILFVLLSLTMDGLTGGMQKRIKAVSAERGVRAKPYDFMFWTNAFMLVVALGFGIAGNEIMPGISFCTDNPAILRKIVNFALLSAVGQSFIFFTISNFEPLVCSTVTTTRKIFSVLLSIFVNKHSMNAQGWAGIGVACLGILGELQHKASKQKKH